MATCNKNDGDETKDELSMTTKEKRWDPERSPEAHPIE